MTSINPDLRLRVAVLLYKTNGAIFMGAERDRLASLKYLIPAEYKLKNILKDFL